MWRKIKPRGIVVVVILPYIVWLNSLRHAQWWKTLGAAVVLTGLASVMISDFGEALLDDGSIYGIRAACFAVGAAAIAVIRTMPGETSPQFRFALLAFSALLALASGSFWIRISEIGGDVSAFTGAVWPVAFTVLILVIVGVIVLEVGKSGRVLRRILPGLDDDEESEPD